MGPVQILDFALFLVLLQAVTEVVKCLVQILFDLQVEETHIEIAFNVFFVQFQNLNVDGVEFEEEGLGVSLVGELQAVCN